ncbi:hypothetical protein [Paramagnetospirillum kuznetsovii]|nr:hypothetical protein [Paramagnetospirillum kuznetsovii]
MTMSRQESSRPQLIGQRAADPWRQGEPSLSEAMGDPIIALVMKRDGLAPAQVWEVVLEAQSRLARHLCRAA